MNKLTHLFMDHMSLQDLSHTAVSLSPSLTHLDLSHNQLRVLQPFTPASPKLARLNLSGNPIYCNCYLLPLREWGIRKKVKLMGACGGPAHFSGENLEAIHPRDLRCQSQEAMLKAEFEEQTRGIPTPTPRAHRQCQVSRQLCLQGERWRCWEFDMVLPSLKWIYLTKPSLFYVILFSHTSPPSPTVSHRLRHTTPLRTAATPKSPTASPPTHASSTCEASGSSCYMACSPFTWRTIPSPSCSQGF